MSDLASSTCIAAPNSEKAAAADQLKKELADRHIALIDNADARVRALLKKAASELTRRQERLAQFAATRTRVNRIINDRLGVLMSQSQFNDAQLTHSDGVGCTAGAKCNGSTTTVTFPTSAARQKRMDSLPTNPVGSSTKTLLTTSVPVSVQPLNQAAWHRFHTGVKHDVWKPNPRQNASEEC